MNQLIDSDISSLSILKLFNLKVLLLLSLAFPILAETPNTAVQFSTGYVGLEGLAFDNDDVLYVADMSGNRIYYYPNGVKTVYIGNGEAKFSSGYRSSSSTSIHSPINIVFDSSNNMYVTGYDAHVVYKIDSMGYLSLFAGTVGSNGTTSTTTMYPRGICIDSTNTFLYIAEQAYGLVRKIKLGSQNEGIQSFATIVGATGLACANTGNVYAIDSSANKIIKIDSTGQTTPFYQGIGGVGLAINSDGYLFMSHYDGISIINPSGSLSLFASVGSARGVAISKKTRAIYATSGGPGAGGSVYLLSSTNSISTGFSSVIAFDNNNVLYAIDRSTKNIIYYYPNNIKTVFVGNGSATFKAGDRKDPTTSLNDPLGMTFDKDNNMYVTSGTSGTAGQPVDKIYKISSTGFLSQVDVTGSGYGICVDNTGGNLYFSDITNNFIRKVSISTGEQSTIGSGMFSGPRGLACDTNGNVYVADAGNNQIKKISSTGAVSVYAGTGLTTGGNIDGPKSIATVVTPCFMTLDERGNLYFVSDNAFSSDGVRMVSPDGYISTLSFIKNAYGIAISNSGEIYVSGNFNYINKFVLPSRELEKM